MQQGKSRVYDVVDHLWDDEDRPVVNNLGTFENLNRARMFAQLKSMDGKNIGIYHHSKDGDYPDITPEAWSGGEKFFGDISKTYDHHGIVVVK